MPPNRENLVTVLGTAYFQPISDLIGRLLRHKPHRPNRVQSSYAEHGYRNLLISAVTLLIATISPLIATAADIYLEKHNIVLNGEIKAGDAERIASVLAPKTIIGRLLVNSPGGDLLEAMRIKDIVKGLHTDVTVAKGGYCVSACFFIFLEGYYRTAGAAYDDGTLAPRENRERRNGMVGIHRPYMKTPTGDVVGVKKQEDLMRSARVYLASKAVPQYLIDEMMSRPSNDIYWLRLKDFNFLGEYSPGDEEALIAKCGYKRIDKMIEENWSQDRGEQVANCNLDYWYEIYQPSQSQYLAKLRTGWRPWAVK